MQDYVCKPIIGQGANDIFVRLGFCPDVIRLTEYATGLEVIWHRVMGFDSPITIVAAGDKTIQTSGEGIDLVAFSDEPYNLTSDPTAFSDANPVENDQQANGIKLTSDLAGLTDHAIIMLEAWRQSIPIVRAVHDGGDNKNTYFQDASVDFKEQGVSGSQQWLLFNITNTNYCHIGAVQKPSGQTKHCRLTAVDSGGTALAACDFDDDDVALIMPKRDAQYPLSDYGHMT